MGRLVEAVKRYLSFGERNSARITTRSAIRKELIRCYKLGLQTGIICPSLEPGVCVGTVRSLHVQDGAEMIGFVWYNHHAHTMCESDVSVNEIKAVCPLNGSYPKAKVRTGDYFFPGLSFC